MYYNPYIVIPLAVWIITQAIKFAVAAFQGTLDFRYLYASGGMPSVHSAVVCSLATTSLLVDGGSSHLFGFTVLFAAIVMYDSFGVRRSTGEIAVALNMIASSLERDRIKLEHPYVRLREILGHKPAEVSIGAVLGIFLACLFNVSRLTAQLNFLGAIPGHREMLVLAILFAVILVGGLISRVVLAARYRGSQIIRRLSRQILVATQTIGWLGLVAAFAQYQRLPYVSWRAWSWGLVLLLLIWALILVSTFWQVLPQALAEEQEQQRKRKWFKKSKSGKS